MQEITLVYSYFRTELFNILSDELGYLTKQFPDGKQALEEAEGQIAEFLNRERRKAYIAGHREGAESVIQDNKLALDFLPDVDAIHASRKYESWKSKQ